jgi:hypothetical protein
MAGTSFVIPRWTHPAPHPVRTNDVLTPLGYQVDYFTREKYRGAPPAELCIATKNGVRHFVSRINTPDYADHHRRIRHLQGSMPHAARIVGPIENFILSVEARGQSLWSMEVPPNPDLVTAQLLEFSRWTEAHGLVHGDVRPWNVFFDQDRIQVIDWDLSAFIDVDLLPRGEVPPRRLDLIAEWNEHTGGSGHYQRFHPDLVAQSRFGGIDRRDALLIRRLLKGKLGLGEAWPGVNLSWYPPWCRP